MKINRLWLDGYGCFANSEFVISPGFQIIAGPNEYGKTTIRSFITEMLYGQKANPAQRRYENSNQLRLPWDKPECYGGRMIYQLDNGVEIEIIRNFDRKKENVQVYDLTNANDITAAFPLEKNREPAFAEMQLGLTKKVFQNIATIGYLNLDDLGDNEALAQIREKMLSLADTGEEGSADGAIKLLKSRIAAIGQPTARTKPLPVARDRMRELQKEYNDVLVLRDDLIGIEEKRRAILEDIQNLQIRKQDLETQLTHLDKHDRAQRVKEAEAITQQIDEITQQCFALGSVRDFPAERLPEFQRDKNLATTADIQLHRTQNEFNQLKKQLGIELGRLGSIKSEPAEDISEEMEKRLSELESKIQRLNERKEEMESARNLVSDRMEAAQHELDQLPDFSKMSADPIEWLTQLAGSFSIAERLRDEEKDKLDRIKNTIEKKQVELSPLENVFANCTYFQDKIRDYELSSRGFDEQSSELISQVENLESIIAEHSANIPGHKNMVVTCMFFLAGLLYVGFTYNPWAGIPAIFVSLTLFWFIGNWLFAQTRIKRGNEQIELAHMQMEASHFEEQHERKNIERMMSDLECHTPRELEASHDKYREAKLELASMMKTCDEISNHYYDADNHLSQLFAELQETFENLHDKLESPQEVQITSNRAMSRYQEYRDAKRRLAENRDLVERHNRELDEISEEINEALKEDTDLSLEVRRIMRDNEYRDECKHTSALSAVRAYRIRNAQMQQRRGRVEILKEKVAAAEEQLESEQQEVRKLHGVLARTLDEVGANSVEECYELAEGSRKHRELWKERTTLEDKLKSVLQGETINELRESADNESIPDISPQLDAGKLRHEIAESIERIDELSKEEHVLHINLTERAAGTRPFSEVEEELDEAQWRVKQLEIEMEATSYAIAAIEEAARKKHSQIAPRLAAIAGGYLSEITNGIYNELMVSRDLQVSVRIPQTKSIDDEPEKSLSTGTVDQIYLALRLALVKGIGEDGESIPMILDDPFSNYDDFRLANAMRLLAHIAETSQVLLFTCREDVVEAGKEVNATVATL